MEKLFFFKKNSKFFSRIFFFEKKVFFRKSHNAENSKRGHSGSLNVFTNRKVQKNARGYPLIESEIFEKKSHSAEKKPKGDPLVSPAVLLEAQKYYGLVRESNPRSPASET